MASRASRQDALELAASVELVHHLGTRGPRAACHLHRPPDRVPQGGRVRESAAEVSEPAFFIGRSSAKTVSLLRPSQACSAQWTISVRDSAPAEKGGDQHRDGRANAAEADGDKEDGGPAPRSSEARVAAAMVAGERSRMSRSTSSAPACSGAQASSRYAPRGDGIRGSRRTAKRSATVTSSARSHPGGRAWVHAHEPGCPPSVTAAATSRRSRPRRGRRR